MGPPGQKNATRCGLWWVEMLKTRDEYKEAATVYFRICDDVLLKFCETRMGEEILFFSAPDNFFLLGTFTFCCNA